MSSKFTLPAVIFMLLCGRAQSQTVDCIKDFDFLVAKIKVDYPGYQDKVTKANKPQLDALEKSIRLKLQNSPDSCFYFLNEYTAFFKDRHLSVSYNRDDSAPRIAPAPDYLMDVTTYGHNVFVNIDSLYNATKATTGIEGVWSGFWGEFMVVRDGERYVGLLTSDSEPWKVGNVLLEFQPVNDTLFNVIQYSRSKDAKPHTTQVSLHMNGKILEQHYQTRYIRKSDSQVVDKTTLHSYIPRYPNGTNTFYVAQSLDENTFFLRIPGFENSTANEFVEKYWTEISSRPNLIIDIRNNGGGSDPNYRNLASIIYSKPYPTVGVEWYASQGNIKTFEDGIKEGTLRNGAEGIKWTEDLLGAMKKNKGGFVMHPELKDYNWIYSQDTVYAMPRNVGIIINEGNGSSAEQFLLAAKNSDKVTLFGDHNTAGVLDYSNLTPSTFPSKKYSIWCPMTRSKRLPENPIDNIGIAPDVVIPFPATEQLYDRLDSWVYFVRNYYHVLKESK